MSCEDCDNEQAKRLKEYYIRVDNGNILVFGCQKHVSMLIERNRQKV